MGDEVSFLIQNESIVDTSFFSSINNKHIYSIYFFKEMIKWLSKRCREPDSWTQVVLTKMPVRPTRAVISNGICILVEQKSIWQKGSYYRKVYLCIQTKFQPILLIKLIHPSLIITFITDMPHSKIVTEHLFRKYDLPIQQWLRWYSKKFFPENSDPINGWNFT